MNITVALAVGGLLVVVLVLLGLWQQQVARAQRDETLAELWEAREEGSHQPLAQYPQIDVQSCIGCGSCVTACPEEGVLGLVDGIAQVIHGSRCIGHARCAEACPIAAIKVGLDATLRPDLPVLTDRLQTSRPGIYIAGELGGLALIRIATEQGVQAVDAIAADLAEQDASDGDPDLLDLLIVGAGPAGLAAALRAKQRRLHYLVIDQDSIGGTVSKYPRRKLTLTGSLSLPLHGEVRKQEFVKEELVQFFEELVLRYELSIQPGVKLNEVHGHRNDFHVQTSQGSLRARRLLLALGKRGTPRRLGIPGEQLEKVLYQLVDAATYTDQHVLVVGGGDSAIEAATALANQPGNSVTLSYRREHFFRLKSRNRERIERYQGRIRILYQSELQQVHPKHVSIATPEGSEQLRNDSVFILAGGEPPLPLLRQIGVRLGGDDEPVESQPVPEDVAVLS